MYREALQKGRGPSFLTALRAVVEKLRREPRTFGDPLYRLPALKLLVYHGMIAPLIVDYGVHDELALVFISGVRMLS